MPRKARRASFWGSFFRSLTTVLLVALVALAGAVAVVPAVTQGKALTVLSGSMEPAFSPGDLIVVSGVNETNAKDLKVGDVITFMPNPGDSTLVTHRIIGKGAAADGGVKFTTQGDANGAADDPVLAQQVRGKYLFHIPYLGYVSDWGSRHAAWAVTGFALILIAWGLWAFIFPSRRRDDDDDDEPEDKAKRRDRRDKTAEAPTGAATGVSAGPGPVADSGRPGQPSAAPAQSGAVQPSPDHVFAAPPAQTPQSGPPPAEPLPAQSPLAQPVPAEPLPAQPPLAQPPQSEPLPAQPPQAGPPLVQPPPAEPPLAQPAPDRPLTRADRRRARTEAAGAPEAGRDQANLSWSAEPTERSAPGPTYSIATAIPPAAIPAASSRQRAYLEAPAAGQAPAWNAEAAVPSQSGQTPPPWLPAPNPGGSGSDPVAAWSAGRGQS
jgi:signal peptidase